MKPFLILQLRPEADTSDDEYAAFLDKGRMTAAQTRRIRLDCEPLPGDLDLGDYAGVIVGGGPGCVSDPAAGKDPVEARIEATILSLMPEICARDIPYLGCCYGLGILAHHLGGHVGQGRYGEPVGPVTCTLSPEGRADPLMAGLPDSFDAFVGHKEAVEVMPEGSTLIARSAPCPVQIMRHGRNVYATQFHPEADAAVFETRIRRYRNKGYFHPDEADDLIAMCRAADVTWPERILQNFVSCYAIA
ncbi:glutamine amidotransferase [Mesobacterium pallidum]|uniref:glutamine amidotransferase n=1 Tax=Mesobacterium pallidum TaxID=2872037 RepID=UPI001EE21573|nr:glutamine amidotransferase [Mesobacterium pallidum]